MGADGGSIPKRCEMIRTAKKTEKYNPSALILANWTACNLSKEHLSLPIVACRHGHIYSKTSILELLIVKRKNLEFPFSDDPQYFSHINSLKDVQELSIKTEFLNYICPVTGRPLNGINRFVFIFGCGCIFSESLFQTQAPNSFICPVCSHKYQRKDIILLDPSYISTISKSTLSSKEGINEKVISMAMAYDGYKQSATSVNNRNADYHPSTAPALTTIVQEKLSVAKGISSINSIYSKPNKRDYL